MNHIKNGVKCEGVKIDCIDAMITSAMVFAKQGQKFTVTSITDGVHSTNSFHYKGLAFDIRTHDLNGCTIKEMAELLRIALGNDFDVVAESIGRPNEHIHIEKDVK